MAWGLWLASQTQKQAEHQAQAQQQTQAQQTLKIEFHPSLKVKVPSDDSHSEEEAQPSCDLCF